jgi:DNA-3-methyladenine glycosylase
MRNVDSWKMKKLGLDFYRRGNVLEIAEDLLGKLLITVKDRKFTSGRIVECEAYAGVMDMASHAAGGKITNRNKVMYEEGGLAYVYLCYGIHHLFNVVTHSRNIPHAILIRGIEPVEGVRYMLRRTGKQTADNTLTRGPGNVSKALGISTADTGISLDSKKIFLADDGFVIDKKSVATSPRIGVDYAGADALLPYRYYVRGNPYVSGKPR